MKIIRVPIPKTREPFINTPLLPLGDGRFWISSVNRTVGALGVVVTMEGKHRLYKFEPRHACFYSAAVEDENTLWLCGDLSRVVRLDLRTGKYQEFATGAPEYLIFQGLVLDHATGKLFGAAAKGAFSFDFRARKPVKVYPPVGPDRYSRFSLSNGDGTYTIGMEIPGAALLRWNPVAETVEHQPVTSLRGRSLGLEKLPDEKTTWFARRGTQMWGIAPPSTIRVWDGDRMRDLVQLPDSSEHNVALAGDKLIVVTRYGEFLRYDAETGALEISKRLPTDAVGHVDCLVRIDKDRLLGTPFITQRFWEVNLRTKQGRDCGKAAPGGGEILQTWKLGGKIYMAAYTGGELVEYEPSLPANFPENPRVVADPPQGMRPVAAANDGRHIFYSCSAPYGTLGSVLTKYDTKTGIASYRVNPLPDQQIQSLWYDKPTHSLIAGTTMQADCESTPAKSDTCFFARISADDLRVMDKTRAQPGTTIARVLGPIGRSRYLCTCFGPADRPVFVLELKTWARRDLVYSGLRPIATGRPGLFVRRIRDQVELWDMRQKKRKKVLFSGFDGYRILVQDCSVYLISAQELTVLDGCID